MANKIVLQGVPRYNDQHAAAEAITPGMLVDINTDGAAIKHAGAGKTAALRFAVERSEMGDGVDHDYETGEQVKIAECSPGDVVDALVPSGEDIAIGDKLESAGTGLLREVDTDADTDDTERSSIVGQAIEALGAITATTRCKVRLI